MAYPGRVSVKLAIPQMWYYFGGMSERSDPQAKEIDRRSGKPDRRGGSIQIVVLAKWLGAAIAAALVFAGEIFDRLKQMMEDACQ